MYFLCIYLATVLLHVLYAILILFPVQMYINFSEHVNWNMFSDHLWNATRLWWIIMQVGSSAYVQ